jgi:misacylated tRNA(Ala) deacylase
MTERVYSTDQYAASMEATIVDVDPDDGRVLLDRTVFYPGGGGQPPDDGTIVLGDERLRVVRVTADARGVWHWLEERPPSVGTRIVGEIDWDRRYRLMRTHTPVTGHRRARPGTMMRTHTAMHALCGVVWDRYRSPVGTWSRAPVGSTSSSPTGIRTTARTSRRS